MRAAIDHPLAQVAVPAALSGGAADTIARACDQRLRRMTLSAPVAQPPSADVVGALDRACTSLVEARLGRASAGAAPASVSVGTTGSPGMQALEIDVASRRRDVGMPMRALDARSVATMVRGLLASARASSATCVFEPSRASRPPTRIELTPLRDRLARVDASPRAEKSRPEEDWILV